MKSSKVIEKLEITGISADGKSVGRHENKVYFVKNGVPGDVVDIQIIGKHKKFSESEITLFHQKSDDRIAPFCEHFGTYRGCKWQHISYEAQLRHKQEHSTQNISKTELPEITDIMGSDETTYYRNKLEFTFPNMHWLTQRETNSYETPSRNALGFRIPKRFDKALNIDHCLPHS